MQSLSIDDKIKSWLKNFLNENNYKIVELHTIRKNGLKIIIYLYREDGVSLTDLENITRPIQAILSYNLDESEEFSLELSSPGINRRFKSWEEMNIFYDKNIKVVMKEDGKIIRGKSHGYENGMIKILTEKNEEKILEQNVAKIFLD